MRVSSGSRTPATSTMEVFVRIVTCFHPLTIATGSTIVDIAGALDPSLRVNEPFLLSKITMFYN